MTTLTPPRTTLKVMLLLGVIAGMSFAVTDAYAEIFSNELYACQKFDSNLFNMNINTGLVNDFITMTIASGTSGFSQPQGSCLGLTVDPTDGQMYSLFDDSLGARYITTLDPLTGSGTAIGLLNVNNNTESTNLIFFDSAGQLYATPSKNQTSPNSIYAVNKTDPTIPDTSAICTFTTNVDNTVIISLNYDSGDMYRITGGTNLEAKIVKVNLAESDCQGYNGGKASQFADSIIDDGITPPTNFGSQTNKIMNMAYDTTQSKYFVLTETTSQSIWTLDPTLTIPLSTELGTITSSPFAGESSRGMAFSIALAGSPPAPVNDLVIAPVLFDDFAQLSWTQPSLLGGNLTHYEVFMVSPHGTPVSTGTTTTNTSITIPNLLSATDYSFAISVVSDIGTSALGNIVDITTVTPVFTTGLYSCDINFINTVNPATGLISSATAITMSVGSSGYTNPPSNCHGITTDPTTQQMYIISEDNVGARFLASIDPTSGSATAIGSITIDSDDRADSIFFDASGTMYATADPLTSYSSGLYPVNKTDASPLMPNDFDQVCFLNDRIIQTDTNDSWFSLNYDDGNLYYFTGEGESDLNVSPLSYMYDVVIPTERDNSLANQDSCTVNSSEQLLDTNVDSINGITYDSNSQLFIMQNEGFIGKGSQFQDFYTVDLNAVVGEIALDVIDGYQEGLAFALSDTPEIPDVVDDFILTAQTATTAQFTWTAPNMNGGTFETYIIRFTSPIGTPNTIFANTTNTIINAGGLTPESGYSFNIEAVNDVGGSGVSSTVDFTTPPIIYSDKLLMLDRDNSVLQIGGGTNATVFLNHVSEADGSILERWLVDVDVGTSGFTNNIINGSVSVHKGLGLTVDPTTNIMYGILRDLVGDRYLASIDPVAVDPELDGIFVHPSLVLGKFSVNGTDHVNNIFFDIDGQMYATIGQDIGWEAEIFTVDKATGLGSVSPICTDTALLGLSVIFALNYENGEIYRLTGKNPSVFNMAQVDVTQPDCINGGETTINVTPSSTIDKLQGFSYDTQTSTFFLNIGSISDEQNIFQVNTNGTTNQICGWNISPLCDDEQQRGLTFTLSDSPINSEAVDNVTITNAINTEIDVMWYAPNSFNNAVFETYQVMVAIGNVQPDQVGYVFNTNSTITQPATLTLTNLLPNTEYSIRVDTVTDLGTVIGTGYDVVTTIDAEFIRTGELYVCASGGGKVSQFNTQNQLARVDKTNGNVVERISITVDTNGSNFDTAQRECHSLAVDPTTSQMYSIISDTVSDNYLTTLNPATGNATVIAEMSIDNQFGFENSVNYLFFDKNGQMYVTDIDGYDVYPMDKTTGISANVPPICVYDSNSFALTAGTSTTYNWHDGKNYVASADGGKGSQFFSELDIGSGGDCVDVNTTIDRSTDGGVTFAYDTEQGEFLTLFGNTEITQDLNYMTDNGVTTVITTDMDHSLNLELWTAMAFAVAVVGESEPVDDLEAVSITDSTLNLQWTQPNTNGGFFEKYTIQVSSPHGIPTTFVTDTTSLFLHVDELQEITNYSFVVDITTDQGTVAGIVLDTATVAPITSFGTITQVTLPVAWELGGVVGGVLPLEYEIGVYDSNGNLVNSFTGLILNNTAQDLEADFVSQIPDDGNVIIGIFGANINYLGDTTDADFDDGNTGLANPFVSDGIIGSTQRTVIDTFHPAENTDSEYAIHDNYDRMNSIALTVLAVLPVALFFGLFTILSPKIDGEE